MAAARLYGCARTPRTLRGDCGRQQEDGPEAARGAVQLLSRVVGHLPGRSTTRPWAPTQGSCRTTLNKAARGGAGPPGRNCLRSRRLSAAKGAADLSHGRQGVRAPAPNTARRSCTATWYWLATIRSGRAMAGPTTGVAAVFLMPASNPLPATSRGRTGRPKSGALRRQPSGWRPTGHQSPCRWGCPGVLGSVFGCLEASVCGVCGAGGPQSLQRPYSVRSWSSTVKP